MYAMSIVCGFFLFTHLIGVPLFYRIGDFADEIEWKKFLSLACTALDKVQCICHVYL